jgi:hypothetical protein
MFEDVDGDVFKMSDLLALLYTSRLERGESSFESILLYSDNWNPSV